MIASGVIYHIITVNRSSIQISEWSALEGFVHGNEDRTRSLETINDQKVANPADLNVELADNNTSY